MVVGYLALCEVGASKEHQKAYPQFAYLKCMHSGLQSVPLAIMTGIDLLTGGGRYGLLVKVTSLGLSIFSAAFSNVIHSSDLHSYNFQKALDYFLLSCFDMIWVVVTLGWMVGAFDPLFAGVAIGVTFGVMWLALGAMIWDIFFPLEHEFLRVNLLPFQQFFGWQESQADDIMAGKRDVAWVLPVVVVLLSFFYGSLPFLFDLAFIMPQPGADRILQGLTLEAHLSILRRMGLSALCVVHLVKRYSSLRMTLTVGIIAVHSYFSLRMRDRLRRFGIIDIILLLTKPVLVPLGFMVEPCARFIEAALKKRSDQQTTNSLASKRIPPNTTRPLELQLSGQEAEFFDECDKILGAEHHASDSQRKLDAANSRRWGTCFQRARPRQGSVSCRRAEIISLVQQCAVAFAASCRAGTACENVHIVTRTLADNYLPSMTDVAKQSACCTVLRALLDGTTDALTTSAFAASSGSIGATSIGTTQQSLPQISPAANLGNLCSPSFARLTESGKNCLRKGGSSATALPSAMPVSDGPPLYFVTFRTVANAFVWEKQCDTENAFQMAKPAPKGGNVNFFCSHTWSDDAYQKATVLRTFLFMQSSLAVTLVSTIMFAVTFIPGGFILTDLDNDIPWWAMSVCALITGSFIMLWGILSHAYGWAGFVPWRW